MTGMGDFDLPSPMVCTGTSTAPPVGLALVSVRVIFSHGNECNRSAHASCEHDRESGCPSVPLWFPKGPFADFLQRDCISCS